MVSRTPAGPVETVAAGSLRGVAVPGGRAGLVIGQDRVGDLVSVAVFRPRPTRVVVVGGPRFAVLLGFRALALGARISIESAYPTQWSLLVRLGLELDGAATRRPAGLPPRPELTIRDQPAGSDAPEDPTPWSTTLTVRPGVSAADADLLARADLVLAQPLSPPEAVLLAAALGRPAAEAAGFTGLRPESVTILGNEPTTWVRLVPTLVEYHLIGDPAER
jgi:hypothetical protein